jgi:predicted nucleic acid-binding protein
MQKSINLLISDLSRELLATINNYGLPIVITNMVVQDIARIVNENAKRGVAKDQQNYEEGLKNEIAKESETTT